MTDVPILIVEQNARASLELANRGYIFERGKIMIEGNSNELINKKELLSAYLGSKII